MKKRFFYFFLVFGLISLFVDSANANAIENSWETIAPPPMFIESPPNDTTVNSHCDLPAPVTLSAITSLGDTLTITPFDSPDLTDVDTCETLTVIRTWQAIDGLDTTSVFQTIELGEDDEDPIINLAEIHDTVSCAIAYTDSVHNLNYDIWRTNLFALVSLATTDNCSGVDNIVLNAPNSYDNPCGTLNVTVTAWDLCGNTTSWNASYTVLDTIAPIVMGVPDDLELTCSDTIPDAPMVTAIDNCSGVASIEFSQDTVTSGQCGAYRYDIERHWTATDSCGNSNTYTQTIEVRDSEAPSFTPPTPIVLDCNSPDTSPAITGMPTNLMDNCTPSDSLIVDYTDNVIPNPLCSSNYTINRNWVVKDLCDNVTVIGQLISVADLSAPTFDVPSNITIDCSQVGDISITGEPTNLMDNCDDMPAISYTDLIVAGSCDFEQTITRTWTATDSCGNATSLNQVITVTDNSIPVFDTAPQHMTIGCPDGINIEEAFADWIANRAGAIATDNCTLEGDLVWSIYNTETTDPPSLPPYTCPTSSDTVRHQVIDIIVTDQCGNQNINTVSFNVIDNVAPVLSECPAAQTIYTSAGSCGEDFPLIPPVIEDDCGYGEQMIMVIDSADITSPAPPAELGETPVDPVVLNFPIAADLPINAIGDAILVIDLFNADAEGDTEFFHIIASNGDTLGQTNLTPMSCGDSQTTITIPAALLNELAVSGTITITLTPNIPAGLDGKFTVNDICAGGSKVAANLSFTLKEFGLIIYEYKIDDANKVAVSPIDTAFVNLGEGTHLITYYATDCAGNIDSCSYSVIVEDNEAPSLVCPSDIIQGVGADSCGASIVLPLPLSANDNCRAYSLFDQVLPNNANDALLAFEYDPNLTDFVASPKVFTFSGVAANAYSDVSLTLDFQGDFNSNSAIFNVLGDDGSILATSNIGDADCNTPGQINITIPLATYNQWAADGTIEITASPLPVIVPPGVPGDGINPCTPVANTGDNDGSSYMYARLEYEFLTLSYYATGETPISTNTITDPSYMPTHDFGVGTTDVFYIMADHAGNRDTCSFSITIEDNIDPTAVCVPASNLFIDPSGLQVEVLSAPELDNGSTDNCGIEQYLLAPNVFTCNEAGSIHQVTLTVVDSSGNSASCMTTIAIASSGPEPTANSGLCGGDTLYLHANPPVSSGGSLYTFKWYNPDGQLISEEENPIIPDIDASDEGPYQVVITGLTGCEADGVVLVNIEDLPLTPILTTPSTICSNEDLELTTTSIPTGDNITYYWFEGIAPMGTLIDSTDVPSYVISSPHTLGTHHYYMEVKANGCMSSPSPVEEVLVVTQPVAAVSFADTTVCSGETIFLGTPITNTGLTYIWEGPNAYSADIQFPTLGPLEEVNEGYYYLTLNQDGGCLSERDSILVTVKPQPAQPAISNNSPICVGEDLIINTTFNGASSYIWKAPNGTEFITSIPSYTIPEADLDVNGDWTVSVIQNGCQSVFSTPTQVVVNANPAASADVLPSPVCLGDNYQLLAMPNLQGASYLWTGPNIDPQPVQNPVISNASEDKEGVYHLEVTTAEGCRDTASVFVEVAPQIDIIGVSSDAPACLDGPTDIALTVTTFPLDDGSYEYQWTGPTGDIGTTSSITLGNATAAIHRGDYQVTVTSIDGCESTLNLPFFLDIRDTPTTPTPPTTVDGIYEFCEGEDLLLQCEEYTGESITYFWTLPDNSMVTTNSPMLEIPATSMINDGDYTVAVTVDGCTSATSAPREVTIYAIPQITATSNSPVCKGDEIQFNTTFFADATYTWQGPDGFNAGIQNPTHDSNNQMDQVGQYWVITTVNGCVSDTAFTNVVLKDIPNNPIATTIGMDSVCVDFMDPSITLTVTSESLTSGAIYSWFDSQGSNMPITTPSMSPIITITDFSSYPTDGIYDFYVQANLDGCLSDISPTQEIAIHRIPADLPFAGNDTTICDNEAAILNATLPSTATGMWSLSGDNGMGVSIANPDMSQTPVNGLLVENSPYTFVWSLSHGACYDYASDSISVVVSQAETADAGDNIIACQGEVINLGATPPIGMSSTAIWTQPSAQEIIGVEIETPNNPSTIIDGLQADNLYSFTWTVTSECGVVSDEILVRISDPSPFAGADKVSCNEDGTVLLTADEPTLGSSGVWTTLDSDITIEDMHNDTTLAYNLKEGLNTFIWTIDEEICGEASVDTVEIFYKLPALVEDDVFSIGFGVTTPFNVLLNDIVPPNSSVVIDHNSGEGDIEEAGDIFTYTPPLNYVGTQTFTYEVESEGCPAVEAEIDFVIGEGAACDIPTIITPNGDNINDVFVVPCLLEERAYPNSQVIIFNRWGDEVYRSSQPYENNWDGKYNGVDLPASTYFYVVDLGDGSEAMTGYLIIQR